ncbi:YhcN/YlaJ family sporulation lipoprotein [Clostridium sp. Cult3]|uniref:YhcN/YlaJ family sporulation lipoprotein n=1 Tax=Clostridium sp. Cult3 TaxID=2079004 RepID=UPI001F271419|nr:YhcN/YlaJ family sporulation lipoprotein [Clostridium sp. Cult3]
MKRKGIYIIRIVLIFMVFSVLLVGCKVNDDIGKEEVEDEISIGVGGKDYDILSRSENISNIVVDLYGIDNASSIIFNDVVVVAVEMAQDTTFNDDVKEMIINAVLENDTMIRQVLITDNKKVFDQIEKIIESLMNGKNYDEHIKEINGIIERLKKE